MIAPNAVIIDPRHITLRHTARFVVDDDIPRGTNKAIPPISAPTIIEVAGTKEHPPTMVDCSMFWPRFLAVASRALTLQSWHN
jgi:hypothetical protein